MTQEEKELFQDLCGRLPYGVKCHFKYGTAENDIILKCIDGNVARFNYGQYGQFHVIIDPKYIKPYLRPMSSMTEEEKKELFEAIDKDMNLLEETLDKKPLFTYHNNRYMGNPIHYELDFLISHHFDYRGLIPMGLALEAPEDIYKN